jgi:hypothetical protein
MNKEMAQRLDGLMNKNMMMVIMMRLKCFKEWDKRFGNLMK